MASGNRGKTAAAERVDQASSGSFPASDPPPWTLGVRNPQVRVERDSMGEVHVPLDALYGAQTQRAVTNFPIGTSRLQPSFVRALGLIKACAARVNGELGVTEAATAAAIAEAADEIASGEYYEQFVVDVFQTGSGTSTNMNANEVIGTLSGAHPNDGVNASQSSNDVIPSAIHVAAASAIQLDLLPSMRLLESALQAKAREFHDIIKIGRTHLQDATPVRLGQEFGGYARQVGACADRVGAAFDGLLELPLGGTAVGTGLNAPPGFAEKTIALIAERTGIPFREAKNHFEAQSAKDAALFLSGALKTYAVALAKIANDVRWMGSGPVGGLAELRLPECQPGSSIMPGKVNPVIPESVLMITAQVIGHDAAITWACAGGNFELNTMMPLLAFDLLDAIEILHTGTRNFVLRCIAGLEANTDKLADLAARSLATVTALVPRIGYDAAAAIAKEALSSGRAIAEVAVEMSGLPEAEIIELLRLKA